MAKFESSDNSCLFVCLINST